MALEAGETLLQALTLSAAGVVLLGAGRAGKAQEEALTDLAPYLGKRARKGRIAETKLKVHGLRPR